MKKGFTLAEVLITLGIIGIVAAITIPGLIAKYQKDAAVTKLKRAISVINQAYKLSYDEVGELPAEVSKDLGSREYFDTYWAPYIKIHNYCDMNYICGYNSLQPYTQANNVKSSWYPIEPRLRTTFSTPDGFIYVILLGTWVDVDGGAKKALYQIFVDINGSEKPNKFGTDVFFLSRVPEDGGGVRPYCYEKSDAEVNENCSRTGVGECCAEKIKRSGWKITNDYPWK